MSLGAGSVHMRNKLLDSQSMQSVQSEKLNESMKGKDRANRHHDSKDSLDEGSPGIRNVSIGA